MTRLQWAVLIAVALVSIAQMLPFLGRPLWVGTKGLCEDRLLLERAATRSLGQMVTEHWIIRRYWRPVTTAWVWATYWAAG